MGKVCMSKIIVNNLSGRIDNGVTLHSLENLKISGLIIINLIRGGSVMSKKKVGIPIFLGIASVWFGAHAGPGAASGKQIAVFYNSFGKWGLITPFLAMGIMAFCIYYSLEYARLTGIRNFKDFTNSFFHPYEKIFSTFFEITFLATVLIVMGGCAATGAEILEQYFSIPSLIGTGLIVFITIMLSIYGAELVRASSTVMTVFIISCLLVIVIVGLSSSEASFSSNWQATSFGDTSIVSAITMAIVYAGSQSAGNMANAVSVSEGLTSRKDSLKAAIAGLIMNTFLILSIGFLIFGYNEYANETLPNYFIVEKLGYSFLLFAYVSMVLLAVLTTMVSYAFSSTARYSQFIPMEAGAKRNFITLAILMISTVLISLLGLDVIVGVGYKYLGYACIFVVIIPTFIVGNKKLKEAKQLQKSTK